MIVLFVWMSCVVCSMIAYVVLDELCCRLSPSGLLSHGLYLPASIR